MATSLELAITAIRSGRKEEGRQLLNLLIQQNPNDEMAWLWMSSVVNTDEQRARCLYHVLAINPNNALARRGLELLGIVVTDSRPVQIPRDSQPIPIPRPSTEAPPLPGTPAEAKSGPLSEPALERKPFRLDPKTITQELPFTPIREPFAEPAPAAAPPGGHSGSILAITEKLEQSLAIAPPDPVEAGASDSQPLPVTPPPPAGPPPSQPVPVANPGADPAAGAGPTGTVPMNPPAQPYYPGPPFNGAVMDTRPSQPVQLPHANVTVGMPSSLPNNPAPPYPVDPSLHSSMTMGMPGPVYVQSPHPWQPVPGIHSHATMGMPMPAPVPGNGQYPYPGEPIPAIHSNVTMGMGYYGTPLYQQPLPNPAYYGSPTAAMPTMSPLEARARLTNDYALGSRGTGRSSNPRREEKEEGEEVNLLAVIIFGSLSVSALGGLGMLILLMFTGG